MLSNKRVLPNFLTTLLFAAAATFSVNVFAGDHASDAEAAIGELKDMDKAPAQNGQAADKKAMLDGKKADMVNKLNDEATAAEKVEGLQPE